MATIRAGIDGSPSTPSVSAQGRDSESARLRVLSELGLPPSMPGPGTPSMGDLQTLADVLAGERSHAGAGAPTAVPGPTSPVLASSMHREGMTSLAGSSSSSSSSAAEGGSCWGPSASSSATGGSSDATMRPPFPGAALLGTIAALEAARLSLARTEENERLFCPPRTHRLNPPMWARLHWHAEQAVQQARGIHRRVLRACQGVLLPRGAAELADCKVGQLVRDAEACHGRLSGLLRTYCSGESLIGVSRDTSGMVTVTAGTASGTRPLSELGENASEMSAMREAGTLEGQLLLLDAGRDGATVHPLPAALVAAMRASFRPDAVAVAGPERTPVGIGSPARAGMGPPGSPPMMPAEELRRVQASGSPSSRGLLVGLELSPSSMDHEACRAG